MQPYCGRGATIRVRHGALHTELEGRFLEKDFPFRFVTRLEDVRWDWGRRD